MRKLQILTLKEEYICLHSNLIPIITCQCFHLRILYNTSDPTLYGKNKTWKHCIILRLLPTNYISSEWLWCYNISCGRAMDYVCIPREDTVVWVCSFVYNTQRAHFSLTRYTIDARTIIKTVRKSIHVTKLNHENNHVHISLD